MVPKTSREEMRAWEMKANHGHIAVCWATDPKGKRHDPTCLCDCHHEGAELPILTSLESDFTDYRGTITNVLSGLEVRHLAVITQAKGTVRGNHYHPDEGGTQWLYLLSGRLTAMTCPLINAEREAEVEEVVGGRTRHSLKPGSLLYIPPWTAHAFHAVEPSVFLAIDEYSHAPERYSVVTRPWELVQYELRI